MTLCRLVETNLGDLPDEFRSQFNSWLKSATSVTPNTENVDVNAIVKLCTETEQFLESLRVETFS